MTARLALSILAGLLAVATAHAAEPPANADRVCTPPERPASLQRQLRSLSLDLRGVVPTVEEHEAVAAAGEISDELLDAWLASEAFAARVVRWHKAIFWNNISNVRLFANQARLSNRRGLWWRGGAAFNLRGQRVECLDEPARFDAEGEVVVTAQPDGSRREGWVEVRPYWAPDTAMRVCALDARERPVARDGTPCDTSAGLRHPDCGCGPGLRWCANGAVEGLIQEAMARDVDRRVERMIAEGRPYLDLFTDHTGFVNGPLVHFWRHQRKVTGGLDADPPPVRLDTLPDLDFTANDDWRSVDLGRPHAGLLTSPAFLLRFQTNRARANRFYTALLCSPFQPPIGGLPPSDDEAALEPDLQQRDGCKYCHALLEPAAAHWGRWTEQGAGFLDPEVFPSFSPACAACGAGGSCPSGCRDGYVTGDAEAGQRGWAGWLAPFAYLRDDHMVHVDQGPALLALGAVVDDRLPQCVARAAVERLFGRPVAPDEAGWLGELAHAFVREGFDYPSLVRAIVRHPSYARIR